MLEPATMQHNTLTLLPGSLRQYVGIGIPNVHFSMAYAAGSSPNTRQVPGTGVLNSGTIALAPARYGS